MAFGLHTSGSIRQQDMAVLEYLNLISVSLQKTLLL